MLFRSAKASHLAAPCAMSGEEDARTVESILEDVPTVVSLSVGGHEYTVSTRTLQADPASRLAECFAGSWRMYRTNSGCVHIDGDGQVGFCRGAAFAPSSKGN